MAWWSAIEMNVAIICVSLAPVGQFVRRCAPTWLGPTVDSRALGSMSVKGKTTKGGFIESDTEIDIHSDGDVVQLVEPSMYKQKVTR
jgi:hypothetical protein